MITKDKKEESSKIQTNYKIQITKTKNTNKFVSCKV